jgi:hypothetical protein
VVLWGITGSEDGEDGSLYVEGRVDSDIIVGLGSDGRARWSYDIRSVYLGVYTVVLFLDVFDISGVALNSREPSRLLG